MKISKAKLNKFALLRHKKYRDRERLFIVQGEKAVADTIYKFKSEAILTQTLDKHSFLIGKKDVYELSETEMKKISTLEKVPDIIAVYRMREEKSEGKYEKGKFSLVLDGVQDPGNLGTIIRTAHWFGIKNIFCSKDTVDVYNPKVSMATMGSIGEVDIMYMDLSDLFGENPEIPVYGLLLEGEDIFKINNLKPGFILMGSEGHGPSEKSRQFITKGITIPAKNPLNSPDSLNVAIATAITLSQLIR